MGWYSGNCELKENPYKTTQLNIGGKTIDDSGGNYFQWFCCQCGAKYW